MAGAPAPADDFALAWLRDGRVEMRPASADARVPLGSVWKLFVFAYAVERGVDTPPYRCGVPLRPGEEYCCDAGQSIERDPALARSCGLFFEPARLGIDAPAWRAFWSERTDARSAWLSDLARLRPETLLSVEEMLHALQAVPPAARDAASRALLPLAVEGYGRGMAAHVGGLLRVKTFTWRGQGGGAGWLVDGTPIWFSASGSSRTVLQTRAQRLGASLPPPAGEPLDDACVDVDYFARYPIRRVDALPSRAPAAEGPLAGRFRVTFENGNALVVSAHGELRLERDGTRLRIRGRHGLGEYVARVIDREGDAQVKEAGRALAVVARTWLIQNAAFEKGCYRVADSTRAQRVSPRAPSASARQAALFTDGLVLRGAAVRYRLEGPDAGALAWKTALRQAQDGRRFDEILSAAFPQASLGAATGEEECRRLPGAQDWLGRRAPRWRRALSAQPGFEAPGETMTVCALSYGSPYVDRARSRIYLRGLAGREDRLTLAHEYVHLGFRFHPCGMDEACVERLARSLTEE